MRQIAMSARLPGSSEPMSSRPSTAAPPRVPSRSASRAVIARGPPRPRATSSACLTSSIRSPRSFEAVPSTPRPTSTPASSISRTRREAGAQAQVRGGAVGDADAVRGEARVVAVAQVDAVRAPDVVGQPADVGQVLDRRAAVALAAERVLLGRLGEVRVQLQAEPPGERGRLLHQLARDRERRARRDGHLQEVAVGERGDALGVGQDLVDRLDERVRRQALPAPRRGPSSRARRRSAAPARAPPAARPRGCPCARAGRRSGGRRRSSSPTARARRARCARPRTRPRRRARPTPGRARRATRTASSPARGRA